MINFFCRQSNIFFKLLLCSLAAIILQGCGAERTTPYNPTLPSSCSSSSSSSSSSSTDIFGTDLSSASSSSSSSSCSSSSSSSSSSSNSSSSSSASSSVVSVEIIQLWSGVNTVNEIIPSGKSSFAIKTADEFDKVIGNYMDPLLLNANTADYFTDGQVIMVYDGEINSCIEHLEFNKSISAYDLSSSSVKVSLGYFEIPTTDKCSPSISHPFALYQIKTKKSLVFEDKIQ